MQRNKCKIYSLLHKLVHLTDAVPEPVVLAFQMMCIIEKYIKLDSVIENQTLSFFCNFVVVRVSLILKCLIPSLKAQRELIFTLKDFNIYFNFLSHCYFYILKILNLVCCAHFIHIIQTILKPLLQWQAF